MAFTADDVFDEAQMLLNDVGASQYTDAVLLPCLVKAYRDLKLRLIRRNAPPVEEISGPITVAAGTNTELTAPADLILPISVSERPVGSASTVPYTPMDERPWEPDVEPADTLRFWTWREGKVKFRGATVAREVQVRYLKILTKPTGAASAMEVEDYFITFLAARTAAIAAFYIGGNETRAAALQDDANAALAEGLGIITKRRQGTPIRQKPYGYWRRTRKAGWL